MGISREKAREALIRLVKREKGHFQGSSVSYRYIGYRKAIKELDAHGEEIASFEDLLKIKHIGHSAVEKIKKMVEEIEAAKEKGTKKKRARTEEGGSAGSGFCEDANCSGHDEGHCGEACKGNVTNACDYNGDYHDANHHYADHHHVNPHHPTNPHANHHHPTNHPINHPSAISEAEKAARDSSASRGFYHRYSSCNVDLTIGGERKTAAFGNRKNNGKNKVLKVHVDGYKLSVPPLFSLLHLVLSAIDSACAGHTDQLHDTSAARYRAIEHSISNRGTYGPMLTYECTETKIKKALKVLRMHKLVEAQSDAVKTTLEGRRTSQLLRDMVEGLEAQSKKTAERAENGKTKTFCEKNNGHSLTPNTQKKEEASTLLLIDSRENKRREDPFYFQRALSRAGVASETRVLSAGDFVWSKVENSCEIFGGTLIERKTVADLLSSLRDGRYRDQKQRLSRIEGRKIYLIEGAPPADRPSVTKAFYTSLIKIAQEGFLAINTHSTEETLGTIDQIHRYVQKEKRTEGTRLENIMKNSRKTHIEERSPEERSAIFIHSIKGVSYECAQEIVRDLGTLQQIADKKNNGLFLFMRLKQVISERKGKKTAEKLARSILHALGLH